MTFLMALSTLDCQVGSRGSIEIAPAMERQSTCRAQGSGQGQGCTIPASFARMSSAAKEDHGKEKDRSVEQEAVRSRLRDADGLRHSSRSQLLPKGVRLRETRNHEWPRWATHSRRTYLARNHPDARS